MSRYRTLAAVATIAATAVAAAPAAARTTATLRTLNDTGTIKVRPGYDDVTGRGTPNGAAFITGVK